MALGFLPDTATIKSLLASLAGVEVAMAPLGVVVCVPATSALEALEALRGSESGFGMLVDLLGADTGEGVEVTYHLRSFVRDEDIYVRTWLPYGGELRSVSGVYASALLGERETAELFGLVLRGHPNPTPFFSSAQEACAP